MKYCFLVAIFISISTLFAQSNEPSQLQKHEISTDLSGAFMNNARVDFSRKGNKKGAFVVGLRVRSESAGVTIDTNLQIRVSDRHESIPQGLRALDLSVGVKSYLGSHQPQRGLWVQLTALTSLVQWQSDDYKAARVNSLYPDEFRQALRMFGIEGDIGYRYVLDNGLSLNAFVSWTHLVLRSDLISERFTQAQRENGGLDSVLSGSFLTLGYVW